MKITRILLTYSFLLAACSALSAQGIEFFHGTWAEAQEKARVEEKLIFVDAFASWCGPCKRMAASVFPQEKVGAYFNVNFINLKIDMEKPENAEFAGKFPVSAYPTLMFIDATGKLVQKAVGAKDADQLLDFAQKVIGRNDKSGDYEVAYNEGKRDPEFLLDYVRALNAAGKPSLRITNEYLGAQSDLTTDINLRFLHEGAVEADSRVFDLLLKHQSKVAALVGTEKVNARIESACKKTLKKAIEFKSEALLDEAKSKMKAGVPARAEAFAYDADMSYYSATKDVKNYLKAAQAYQKGDVKNNSARLHDLVISLLRAFPDESKVLDQAQKWSKTAAENGGMPEYYLTLAEIYKRQGNKEKALDAAENARKAMGEKDNGMGGKIDYFIRSLGE
ncbi:MAG: thioredoxin family protein [Lewinellaceae bacterium]|jgi:thiol-disulfide isomerase/thioredoxin|nr:thioredoxin family protein [Lewinellaceae bacterium]